jgi:hypothetical protein
VSIPGIAQDLLHSASSIEHAEVCDNESGASDVDRLHYGQICLHQAAVGAVFQQVIGYPDTEKA